MLAASTPYGLPIPAVERAYLAKSDGGYDIGGCYLTISLGEPYRDACYKLIAAIIPAT